MVLSNSVELIFFVCVYLGCFTIGRNGHLVIWEPSIEVQDLQSMKDNENIKAKAAEKELEEPDDISENEDNAAAESVAAANNDNKPSKLFYSKKSKHFLRDALPKDPSTKGELS